MTPDTDDATAAETIAALKAEIERLKTEHALQVRRLEIEGFKAENEMAMRLRNAGLPVASAQVAADDVIDPGQNHLSGLTLWEDRGTLGRILFRKDGRPCRPLRLLLFSRTGKVRPRTRRLVIRKNGQPRKTFKQWMISQSYQRLPDAYRNWWLGPPERK